MKISQKIKRTKTGTIMKSENNKNWQHRKNIIGDTGCQEAEMRKEKWHKRKWQSVLFASAFSWPLITFLIAFFNYHQKVTFINLALGLLAINMVFCFCVYMISKAVWNLYPKISLKNNIELKYITIPDYWKDLTGNKFKFDKIDDKQIIIDNDHILERVFSLIISLFILLILIWGGDITPSKVLTENYVIALLLIEFEIILITVGVNAILQPWQRIVFNRETKTVTISSKFIFQKKKIYPYNQLVVTLCGNYYAKTFSGKGQEEIVIANPQRTLGRISLGIAGGINAARQFARFIQLYMEEEELQNIPNFEKYKNNDKQEADQDRMEDINTW